jgi:hypothetical protein
VGLRAVTHQIRSWDADADMFANQAHHRVSQAAAGKAVGISTAVSGTDLGV